MSEYVDISGLNKADVLAILFNAALTGGMGFMQYDATPMNRATAQAILDSGQRNFDYLQGRVMKFSLEGDTIEPGGYDRDNGAGKLAELVEVLRQTGEVNPATVQDQHAAGVQLAAVETRDRLKDSPFQTFTENGNPVIEMSGFSDVADVLGPAIDRAVGKQES